MEQMASRLRKGRQHIIIYLRLRRCFFAKKLLQDKLNEPGEARNQLLLGHLPRAEVHSIAAGWPLHA